MNKKQGNSGLLQQIKTENASLHLKIKDLYKKIADMKLENRELQKFQYIYNLRLQYLRLSNSLTQEEAIQVDLQNFNEQRSFLLNHIEKNVKTGQHNIEISIDNVSPSFCD